MSTVSTLSSTVDSLPLPSLFVSHGSPMLAVEPGRTGPLLASIGATLPRPRGIVMVSPHWETFTPRVGNQAKPRVIHDFGGFPQELYELDYPAPGAPALAEHVAQRLRDGGLPANTDGGWGLDHGAWVPLRYLYPQADVPVIQLSLQSQQPPEYHYQVGRLLAPLAKEGILLIGSGSFTHNLRELRRNEIEGGDAPHTLEFLRWFLDRMQAGDLQALFGYRTTAPHAVRTHPSDEHLLSLFFAMGAADDWTQLVHLDSGSTYHSLRMDAFAFGTGARLLAQLPAAA
ncbi:dioxygenase [Herbaspirillum sp. WGmk3]|uniref:dioxygenase family protein n=1 Tax=Herbaspirillum TaxID=963 RepID=UPI001065443B|nr:MULTISPECIES: class III extradiol ring-cleavage dioxygenase [Herbaspirillum]MCO4858936.1 dioxygenase [Herbaspirillum sp. WGmk3]QBP74092.1 dioxygenase [Herbaspirillum huttiense]